MDRGRIGAGFPLDGTKNQLLATPNHTQRFADQFLTNEEVDIPRQLEFVGPVELRWVQVSSKCQ